MYFLSSQATLKDSCTFSGVGLHNGQPCTVIVHPAPENHGIVFYKEGQAIPACFASVISTSFCVKIGVCGITIQTIEHLLCALLMNQISNAVCEVFGEEIPILDGSANLFSQAFHSTGIYLQNAPRKIAKIQKTIEVSVGNSHAIMRPCQDQLYEITLDYQHPALPPHTLHKMFSPSSQSYFTLIDRARTYGFLKDQPFYQKQGIAKGAGPSTALIFNEKSVENSEGMRSQDEITCHKILDCIGDLSLLGGPFLGHYKAIRPGHSLNVSMVRSLIEQQALVWQDALLSPSYPPLFPKHFPEINRDKRYERNFSTAPSQRPFSSTPNCKTRNRSYLG